MLGIIGVSGRTTNYTKEHYETIYRLSKEYVKSNNIKEVVSGGSSLSDHCAVALYLNNEIDKLVLHLPCNFINGEYNENNRIGKNISDTLNTLHKKFYEITNINSLQKIQEAIIKGAIIIIHKGFIQRDSAIAKDSKYLITFNMGNHPTGGTKITIKKYIENEGTDIINYTI